MADDFKDVVEEIKKTNKAVDKLAKATDPKGAAAAEDKRDEANAAARSESYLKTIADAVGGGGGGGGAGPPEDKKSGGMLTGIAGALGSMGGSVGKGIGGFVKGIGAGASGAVQFAVVMTAVGAGIAGFITALGAGAWAVAKMMPTIAEGLKSFDGINGANLGKVGKGMGHLGVGLASMGTGGAIAGIGGLIGNIADGIGGLFGAKSGQEQLMDKLKKFSAVKLNVKNIKDNSEAMVAYGIAMTAGSAGSMLGSLATLADGAIGGLGKLFGGVPVLTQLIEFSKADVDGVKVKKNADAMVAYAGAMTAGAGASAMKSVAGVFTMITSFTDGISNLLGGKGGLDTQLEDMKKLSAAADSIDETKIKSVAGAMVAYAGAMTAGVGATAMKSVAGVFTMVTSFTDGVSKLLGGKGVLDTQLESLQKMSAAGGIDGAKIKLVAAALVDYAEAMATGAKGEAGKAGASIGVFVGSAVDGLTSFITGGDKKVSTLDTMLTSLQTMSAATGIDGAKIKLVAEAMVAYGEAMAAGAKGEGGKAVGAIAGFASGVVSGLSSFFGIKKADPLVDLKKFASTIITKEEVVQIKLNATGITAYAEAMSAMGKITVGKSFSDTLSNVFSGIGSLFSGSGEKSPMTALQNFASANIDGEKIKKDISTLLSVLKDPNVDLKKSWIFRKILKNIAAGLEKFTAPGGFTSLLASAGKSLLKFLTGDKSPIEQIEIIAGKSIELREGAAAIETISDGLEKMASLKFDGSNINISDFAADLLQSVPLIEAAIMGGKVEKSLLEKVKFWKGNKDEEFQGLSSDNISWGKAAANIKMMRLALGGAAATEMGGGSSGKQQSFKLTRVNRLHVNTLVAQRLINRAIEKGANDQGGSNINVGGNTNVRGGNTTTITNQEVALSNENSAVRKLNSAEW